MSKHDPVKLTRDVEATRIPSGEKLTLKAGLEVGITQSLGGTYTVVSNQGMARIESRDADALGLEAAKDAADLPAAGEPLDGKQIEAKIWELLKTVYDPEIPVNIVDLGLVYDLSLEPKDDGTHKAQVKMTLTAPGCGMGPVLQNDAQNKILSIGGVSEAEVFLVWEPPWHQGMISEVGRMKLGLV